MRYDQFMHLGWKVLIPVNLIWIMAVAALHVLGHVEQVGFWNLFFAFGAPLLLDPGDRRHGRSRAAPAAGLEQRGRGGRGRGPARPVLPGPAAEPGRAEAAASRRGHRAPAPALEQARAGRQTTTMTMPDNFEPSPTLRRLRQGLRADLHDDVQEGLHAAVPVRHLRRPRRAITAGTCSTATRTGSRSASAASCAPGPARPTRSTSRAATTPRPSGTRRVSATARSIRSTTCGAFSAGCASRPARPGR